MDIAIVGGGSGRSVMKLKLIRRGASSWAVATALKAEAWVETVTEGGRRFMAAWRKEEVDAARHRQEKREATRLGNLLSQTGALRSHTHWPNRRAEDILVRTRDRPRPA